MRGLFRDRVVVALFAAVALLLAAVWAVILSAEDAAAYEAPEYVLAGGELDTGPISGLPAEYSQTVVTDRHGRAYVLVEGADGALAITPYLDADGAQETIE